MQNQVKVRNIDTHITSQGGHIVCEGKLQLIKSKEVENSNVYVNNIGHTSYIVSETELIHSEDKVLYKGEVLTASINRGYYLSTYEYTSVDVRTDSCKKILALPENFSPKHLQAIVDDKLENNDNVLVECYPKVMQFNQSMTDFNLIKLNKQSHIKLFPVKKKDDLADRLFKLANDFAVAKEGDIAVQLHTIRNSYLK